MNYVLIYLREKTVRSEMPFSTLLWIPIFKRNAINSFVDFFHYFLLFDRIIISNRQLKLTNKFFDLWWVDGAIFIIFLLQKTCDIPAAIHFREMSIVGKIKIDFGLFRLSEIDKENLLPNRTTKMKLRIPKIIILKSHKFQRKSCWKKFFDFIFWNQVAL